MPLLRSLLLLLVVTGGSDVEAQVPEARYARGQVVEHIACLSDPTQSYALYLPSDYDSKAEWPVLMVLDPRGQGRRGVELFRDGAERYGYVILSSYQTRSGSGNANGPALKALLLDAGSRFDVDSDRLYLAGMSGTAKVLWRVAPLVRSHLAGIIGSAGGLPDGDDLDAAPGFDVFLTTGVDDFNYRSIRRLDDRLSALEAHHHLEVFEGGHRWPPQEIATEALAWMSLRAMQRGLSSMGADWVNDQFRQAMESFESLVADGEELAAVRKLEAIVRDFRPFLKLEELDSRLAVLARSKSVVAARKRDRRLASLEHGQSAALGRWIEWFVRVDRLPSVSDSLKELEVPNLRARQTQVEDAALAHSATRRLELIYVHTSYSLPNRLIALGAIAKAARSTEIATEVYPQRSGAWWKLADLRVRQGKIDAAFTALRSAVSLGNVDVDRLKSDDSWIPLRADPRWLELLEGLQPE